MKVDQRDICQETPVEESIKYLHLQNYLINVKKIREAWINNSTRKIKQP